MAAALSVAVLPTVATAKYREVAVDDGGKISGRVQFVGDVPKSAVERYPVPSKSPGCGTGYRELRTIDVRDGALRGCFVMITGLTEGKKWPPKAPPELDQKGCQFFPTLQIVRRGDELTVKNSDADTSHNVNAREIVQYASGRSVRRTLFNLAQPKPGQAVELVSPKKSPFVTVGCDIHNFMVAHIVASDHPYAMVVDDRGRFSLDDVPPGTHDLAVWHPKLGMRKTTVTVPPRGAIETTFEFRK